MDNLKTCFYGIILYSSLFIAGCSTNKQHDQQLPDKVTLIFQNDDKEALFDRRVRFKYVDDHLIPHEFNPGEFDQFHYVLSTSGSHLDIAYYDNNANRHFLFKNGDSVLFSLKNDGPLVKILNREAGEHESNFETTRNKELYNNRPSALEDFYFYWGQVNKEYSIITGVTIANELRYLREKAMEQLDRELHYLDSLFESKKIGREVAWYYKLRNDYEQNKINLFLDEGLDLSNSEVVNTLISQVNTESSNHRTSVPAFFDDFITTYYFAVSELRGKSNLDSLAGLEGYSSTFGRSLLYKHTNQLLSSSSISRGIELLEPFEGDTLLNYWTDHFYSKYNLDQKFNSDWGATSNSGHKINFENILSGNRGNLLYVDLWASWCRPSIDEMPALEKLVSDYKDEAFTVVNISVDKEINKWEWADKKYLQFNNYNSFLLDTTDLATIRETFVINRIPRFLLFDQNGNLIHANAPRPGSKEIRVLIDTYLDKAKTIDPIM